MSRPSPLLVLLGLLAACDGAAAPAPQAAAAPPALVQLAIAGGGSLTHSAQVIGEVVSLGEAELAAGAAGPVEQVLVREGDRVKRGDLLLQVDPRLASASLAVAEAQVAELSAGLAFADRDLARLNQVQGQVLAEAELDRARSAVEQTQGRLAGAAAQVAQARELLRRHSVRAPFDGVVTVRRVDPGAWVQVGQGLLSLVADSDLEVRASVPVDVARALERGGNAEIVGSSTLAAQVLAVVPVLNAQSRTALVRLKPGSTEGLLVGMAVSVRLTLDHVDPGAASVPRDALVLGPLDTRVTRAVDGKAEVVAVQVLATSDDMALVVGVSPGDQVVVKGNERVRQGQELKAVAAPEGAAHE